MVSDLSRTIVFAGGGSGGHISPGLAIAERLCEISPQSKAIFVCSQRAIDAKMLSEANVEFAPIPATPPSFKPLVALRFFSNFRRSKQMVRSLIRTHRVDRVVLLGGFIAAPVASAAQSMGVPVMLVNLDAPPGKANRWMAKRSTEVISAIELPTMPHFASRVVGMPIRRRALASAEAKACRVHLGLPPDKLTLLVTGASQGATSINLFMMKLAKSNPAMFRDWHIYHLAGHGSDEQLREAYRAAGVQATVEAFQDEMGMAWGACDLAISRAGASSVAEAAANHVPTLFLPYPYHKDMHQKYNAQPLVDRSAAVMAIDHIDALENVQRIGPVLERLMNDAGYRFAIRANLKAIDLPDGALTIARLLIE